MMSQACPINGCRRFWPGTGVCRLPGRKGGTIARVAIRTLLRQRFRLLFRRRSEVGRRQQAADEHYQQIDFHVTLRCTIAASPATMQKAFLPKGVPSFAMTLA